MDIIQRNFFRILRSGALNEFEPLEPMSPFKWRRLMQMVHAQHVSGYALKGIRNHQYETNIHIPNDAIENLQKAQENTEPEDAQLSNRLLNRRLKKIQQNERHAIDASMETLQLLNIIVRGVSNILNHGISMRDIIDIGIYLRTQGDKVDFVKLDDWLLNLHMTRMAQLEGSILITVFGFEIEEVPFVSQIEKCADKLTLKAINNLADDTAKEWHFRQTETGFVSNNSSLLRKNLRRSFRYLGFAPIETTSNFVHNFTRSLSEIEE